MTPLIIINLLIWLLLLVLMGTNKFPLGAVSLSIMLLLVLTGCITSPEALAKFSDNNVIIMGTMMITANAFGKTRAVKSIAKLLTKAGKGRWENAIRMFMVVAFRAKCKMFSRHLQKPILKTEKGRFKGL